MNALIINRQLVQTAIFDFDGTLARLNIDFHMMRQELDSLIASYGINPHTLKNNYILEKIHEAEFILEMRSREDANNFIDQAYNLVEIIEMEAAKKGELFPHTKQLLTTLKDYGIGAGIITRNCQRAIDTVFPDILSYCPVLVCRNHVRRVKPDPEHIYKAIRLAGGDPHLSIMIGDHPLDIETGRKAGTLTAGVLTGHFHENDFVHAGADLVLRHAADILSSIHSD